MALFYFDIRDGEDFPDFTGSEWPDLQAVRREAIRLSGEVLREMPERFWSAERWTMTVLDHKRTPLFTLKFTAEMTSATPLGQDIT